MSTEVSFVCVFPRNNAPSQLLLNWPKQPAHKRLIAGAICLTHQVLTDVVELQIHLFDHFRSALRLQAVGELQEITNGLLSRAYRRPGITDQHNALGGSETLLHVSAHRLERTGIIASAVVSLHPRVPEDPRIAT